MWEKYEVTMTFEHRVCGSVPQSKELVPIWIKSRMPKNKPENGMNAEELEQEVLDTMQQEMEEKTTLGFQQVAGTLAARGGTIKAHLKDCANQIKDAIKPQIKAFRAKIANKVYVEDYWVQFERDGKTINQIDGSFEQPVHVMTPMGPRNALKVIGYLEYPMFKFTLMLLPDKEITIDSVKHIFEYGSVHGYGGERGMGEGRYTFEITAVEG